MEATQRRMLIVDDDVRLLSLLQSLLSDYAGGRWQIQTASETALALAILQTQAIDLLVIDVHMPVVDGVQFLRLLQKKFPGMGKVVLTGDATGAHRQICLDSGADLYLEKPRAVLGWQSVFATLDQLVQLHAADSGFQGMLRRVELQDVLQMECLARSSSVLEINAGTVSGRIFIKDGNFIHAELPDKVGEDAFNTLLALSRGEFTLHAFAEPAKRTIEGSWEFLLMEAARRRDELAETAGTRAEDTAQLLEALPEEELTPATHLRPAPAIPMPVEAGPVKPRIDEVLLCSARGDVLYEWQSGRPEGRIQLMTMLRLKAGQMSEGLALGPVDQLEVDGGANRVLLHLKPDCSLLVRSSRMPCPIETLST